MDLAKQTVPVIIAVSAAFTLAIAVIPGFIWVGSVSAKSEADSKRIDRITDKIHRMDEASDKRQDAIMNMLTETRDRTIRIETKQGDLEKYLYKQLKGF